MDMVWNKREGMKLMDRDRCGGGEEDRKREKEMEK